MKKLMSPELDLVQSIFSSLSALTKLMLPVFSSSLFDINIFHNQCKLVSVNQRSHIKFLIDLQTIKKSMQCINKKCL